MSDSDEWVWEDEPLRKSMARPQETLAYLRASAPFTIVRADHLALIFVRKPSGQPLFSASLRDVFLCLLSHVNWDLEEQGGYPACWPGNRTMARETGWSENTVSAHLAALSDGPFILRSRNGEVRYPGLRILRKAAIDEALVVRDQAPGSAGRPLTVWILCHPRDWRLPAFAREEFERRLVQLRNRHEREPRTTGSGRRRGRRSKRYGGEQDGGTR